MTGPTSTKKQFTPAQLEQMAERIAKKTFQGSSVADNTEDYPKFDWSELSLGRVLGVGGFATVYEVRAFATEAASNNNEKPSSIRRSNKNSFRQSRQEQDDNDEQVANGEAESRKFIAEHCLRNGGDARYAVKKLSKELVADPQMHLRGIVDMAIEARFLSFVVHPNIVKMRAVTSTSPYKEGLFIVMDRLYDTLEKRIDAWKARNQRCQGLKGKIWDRNGSKAASLYEERIVAAFDLSAAFAYLHEHKIIYRDIKPENIGFDIRGDIKIFDFGLAKELLPSLKNDDYTYKLTEMTGSPRYMSPEVANCKPYNEKCDVYSFAILLWEMMALKRPFEAHTTTRMREEVYNGPHNRPFIQSSWHNSIKILLKRCWDADMHARSTMAQVEAILRKESVAARDGDETGLEHNQRRSTFVFRPNNNNSGDKKQTRPPKAPRSTPSKLPSHARSMATETTERAMSFSSHPLDTSEVEC